VLLLDLKMGLQMAGERLKHLAPHLLQGQFGVGTGRPTAPSSEQQSCVVIIGEIA